MKNIPFAATLSVSALVSISALVFSAPSPAQAKRTPQAAPKGPSAVAELKPTQGNKVEGTVRFDEMGGKVHVVADISGLAPGKHGFHIHDKGDCSAPDATSAGGHFNPESKLHGAPDADEHHAGDFGNLDADAGGKAHLDTTVTFVTVSDGSKSVAGHGVIVHAAPDDFKTQPTGNAGARLACGVVERR